jgi:GT2 family glycosyltransferase
MRPVNSPQVSVIISVYNRLDLTKACLDSLEKTIRHLDWEAIIVDDGSTDGTREFLATLPAPYRVLLNDTKRNYSANNNRAATVAQGEYLCLLNNDTILTPGWIEPMLKAFGLFPDAGIVGNVQRNPRTGRYDHMGIVFSRQGRFRSFGKHFLFRPFRGYTPWKAVTAACCLIKKSVFLQHGGFDEEFINGCEDLDLCLRLGQHGFKHYVANDSVVLHHLRSSPGRAAFDAQNTQKLKQRWKASLPQSLSVRDRGLFAINACLSVLTHPWRLDFRPHTPPGMPPPVVRCCPPSQSSSPPNVAHSDRAADAVARPRQVV